MPYRVNCSLWRLLLKRTLRELCTASAACRARQQPQHAGMSSEMTTRGRDFFLWHEQASSLQAMLVTGAKSVLPHVASLLPYFSGLRPGPVTPARTAVAKRPKNPPQARAGQPCPPWPNPGTGHPLLAARLLYHRRPASTKFLPGSNQRRNSIPGPLLHRPTQN